MKGLLNVQPLLFKAEGGLLALRETRYPITSFFTINEARVSKDGRWCVSFTDDDTRARQCSITCHYSRTRFLLFQCSKCRGAVAYICGESVSESCMPQNALTHHCFTTELKLMITFYRRFWDTRTQTYTQHTQHSIFLLQTFHDCVYCVLYYEIYLLFCVINCLKNESITIYVIFFSTYVNRYSNLKTFDMRFSRLIWSDRWSQFPKKKKNYETRKESTMS